MDLDVAIAAQRPRPIHLGAAVQQKGRDVDVSRPGRHVERRRAFGARAVNGGPAFENICKSTTRPSAHAAWMPDAILDAYATERAGGRVGDGVPAAV